MSVRYFRIETGFFPSEGIRGNREKRQGIPSKNRFYLYICLQVPVISLDFIRSENKDFGCIYLRQKEKITTIKTILI